MIPKGIHPTLLLNDNNNYILFKTAIYFAELGLNVWFISPNVIDKIPENISPPDKEILQLIIFIYLKNYKDLITHLNAIHMWHKSPTVIILGGFDIYTNLYGTNYDPTLTGLISSIVLDSAAVCTKKNNKSVYVILATKSTPEEYKDRIKVLYDLYFPNLIHDITEEAVVLDAIIDYYKNK
ncbi:uncharacterized protein LOC130443418 isoform X1 [Diorhabda sublineata]|uniref:uncharacterized protein LOC130443418 isoform X1 n=1 Tax=Diorhabda sublineata TaxID=1163346 RepID=UPI0024E093B1|nr:uncharacterized protein LOC130443418 isoform X1 [Diorhabda sublineata]